MQTCVQRPVCWEAYVHLALLPNTSEALGGALTTWSRDIGGRAEETGFYHIGSRKALEALKQEYNAVTAMWEVNQLEGDTGDKDAVAMVPGSVVVFSMYRMKALVENVIGTWHPVLEKDTPHFIQVGSNLQGPGISCDWGRGQGPWSYFIY